MFLVGCGRCGSSLVHQVVAGHPATAWFSTLSERFPGRPVVARASRLYARTKRSGWLGRLVPSPNEAYAAWDSVHPLAPEQRRSHGPALDASDVSDEERQRARWLVSEHLRHQGGTRFVHKNTRNTRRIPYLEEIFPDARFVHLVRDPHAAIPALLSVGWWPSLRVWCAEDQTPAEWVASGQSEAALAARVWATETELGWREGRRLGDRYRMVFYEDLVADPVSFFRDLFEHAQLSWPAGFEDWIAKFGIGDFNAGLLAECTASVSQAIDEICLPLWRKLRRSW